MTLFFFNQNLDTRLGEHTKPNTDNITHGTNLNAQAIANKVICRRRARLRWPVVVRLHQLFLQPSPECLHAVLQNLLHPERVCCLEHRSLRHLPSRRFVPIQPRNLALALLSLFLATSSSPHLQAPRSPLSGSRGTAGRCVNLEVLLLQALPGAPPHSLPPAPSPALNPPTLPPASPIGIAAAPIRTLLGHRVHRQPPPEWLNAVLKQPLHPEQVWCLEHRSLQQGERSGDGLT
jgi:hypothetical protein